MHRTPPGRTITVSTQGEPFQAFVPAPLPPMPPVQWDAALRRRFDDALVVLGRLDAVSAMLPNAQLVLCSFVRKEAVLSSQIEGTQSSLSDLMLFEIDEQPGVPMDDAREVSRCVAAMEHGLARLREGVPISLRLMREMHGVLLDHPRGAGQTPGEFRRSQVCLSGTRPGNAVPVPPPADQLAACLDAFERFLHDQPEPTSPLLRAALAHVQFETIHPFLDGNGPTARPGHRQRADRTTPRPGVRLQRLRDASEHRTRRRPRLTHAHPRRAEPRRRLPHRRARADARAAPARHLPRRHARQATAGRQGCPPAPRSHGDRERAGRPGVGRPQRGRAVFAMLFKLERGMNASPQIEAALA
jgi:Fic/DOC family N-terminal/Fic/DOC family